MRHNELPMVTELITGKTPCLQALHSNFYNTLFFVAAFLYLKWYHLGIQFSSVTKSCATLCNPMDCNQASLSITSSRSLLKFISTESVIPSNHLILCHPLLLLPSVFPSIRVFSSESVLPMRWPKYWSFSFSISPSNEFSGLICFSID